MFCIFFLLINSCKDGLTDIRPIKDPGEYVWKSDTLFHPVSLQDIMYSMWGNSTNNIYAVGHSDISRGLMWHYDGNKWTDVKLSYTDGGQLKGSMSLWSVYGFSPSNIWAVGSYNDYNPTPPPTFIGTSLIIHYDGTQWKPVENLQGETLSNISGNSENEIWTGGYRGTIFHFDGSQWKRDTLGLGLDTTTFSSGREFILDGICRYGSEVFALGTLYNSSTGVTRYYFMKKKDKWAVADSFYIYSGLEPIKWGRQLYMSKDGRLFSYGNGGIFLWDGNSWQRKFTADNVWNMYVRNDGHIFVVIGFGKLFYYDGSTWKEITAANRPDLIYTCVWADDYEVFIAGATRGGFPQRTVIVHGE